MLGSYRFGFVLKVFWLSYTPSVELVVGWAIFETSLFHSDIINLVWPYIPSWWARQGKTNYIYKYKPAEHSDPLKSSPRSRSQSVSDSVGIMSTCSLLAFPLLVSLTSLYLRCLCFSVSWTHNCARLSIVATPVLTAVVQNQITQSCMATIYVS